MKLDALFFAAHPDDVELSCGGTLLKITKSGKKAGIIDLTQGELGTRGSKQIRKSEALKASSVLRVSLRRNLKIPDGNIENSASNRLKIIKIIRELKPQIIFLPHSNDRHPDHQHAHILIREAAFYSGLPKIKTKLNGRPQTAYRPKRNIYFMQTNTFEPSFIIDITNNFAGKMKAVNCYKSQFYNPGSKEPGTFISDKKFIEYIEARARFYGFHAGVKYGEPFYVEEKILLNLNDLFS